MMKAARIVAPERIEIEMVPEPTPARGEVRIRVEGCGVCASNLGPWHGLPWTKYPLQPGESGHEAFGIVDALGADVAGWKEGDRVTGLTNRSYAEYDIARADQLVRMPSSLAIPGEPFGCAINVLRRSDVRAGQVIAVVGVGFLGAILCRLASRMGARIIALSRRPYALELAKKMGATHVIQTQDRARAIEAITDLTAGALCDRVFELTGHQRPLDLAGELVKERGRLI